MGNEPNTTSDVKKTMGEERESFAVDALSFLAWINLIAGIGGAFWLWSKFSSHDPIILSIVLALLFQSIFGSIFFLVVVFMADNLVAIRKAVQTKKD
jgi:hypothetical protein